MWVLLALCSALFLGIYDIFKKKSLNKNAVVPVLFISLLISTVLMSPAWIVSQFTTENDGFQFYMPQQDLHTHLLIMLKAVFVTGSWLCGYFAIKHLPITIFAPIRATQPLWTVIGAMIIYSEDLSPYQWLGVCITLTFFFLFSTTGHKEGIYWKSNKWIWLIIGATLLGAASGIYDKHLLRHINKNSIQFFCSFYQTILMLVMLLCLWWPTHKKTTPFQWRWSIVGISGFLMIADYMYYWALSDTDSLISVVSTIRRSGAIVSFLYGATLLREKNLRTKGIYLAGVLTGVTLLVLKQ